MLECGVYRSSSRELGSEGQESLLSGIKGSKRVQQVIQNSISVGILLFPLLKVNYFGAVWCKLCVQKVGENVCHLLRVGVCLCY